MYTYYIYSWLLLSVFSSTGICDPQKIMLQSENWYVKRFFLNPFHSEKNHEQLWLHIELTFPPTLSDVTGAADGDGSEDPQDCQTSPHVCKS